MSEPDASALPDRALLQALELAVGVAAAGAKLRPPMPYPAGLKPFLKFHKLPTGVLGQVRTAVDGDPVFIRKLASVVTDELVDAVGLLWLTRPDGWQERAAALVAAAGERPVEDAGELRREQKRRESAEGVATRARLEVVTLREQLAAERTGRQTAEVEAQRSSAELQAARDQARQLERAVKKRAAGTDAALGKVDDVAAELDRVRAELADAVEARDVALADRAAVHSGGAVDIERVRALLSEALAATHGPATSARRKRRKPIAVPGGVYGNSEAAGEHLLRTADAVVLIDGYNVAKLGWPGLQLDQQRARCIEAAENLARRWGSLIHIVFDGASVVGAAAPGRRMVRVSFSPEGVIADDVLRAEVAALDPNRPVVVVTNDQAVVTDVRAAGANVLSSEVFLTLARR